ncbi:SAM-dependent methyltransferase [Sphingomonas sp. HDW15A]|uniref:Eco57I restriction-modification methylase domain-containing protein n=1 Tax=Sphingomonas sp. HDW15A TaxID=2714942 RepID=UPI00140CDE80|nr:Eco57I restriction-modification methylase domain-containing protein [Sphingomonas sp. HDW15A]QIK96219.1 SAM-dependent methyltransferase [Sphingomonas sp. HDW15A]
MDFRSDFFSLAPARESPKCNFVNSNTALIADDQSVLGRAKSGSSHAEEARLQVSPDLDPKRRSEFGQFMTPASVASFMAGLFEELPDSIRLLDAGAGMGALTAAFVDHVCGLDKLPTTLDVTTFEVDTVLAERLERTLLACADQCEAVGINFSSRIIRDDYLLHSSEPLMSGREQYDCALLNPPYAKINSGSKSRAALRTLGIETSNLYAAFVAVALGQMVRRGQLVAITPRSFCNGRYFDPFRKLLVEQAAFRQIHVYESRKKAFADDSVLQENIIYRLVKGELQPATVTITSSAGPNDEKIARRMVPFAEVVRPNDPHRYIHLAISDADSVLAERVRALPCSLKDLGVTVSTGRVVDFRARDQLRKEPELGAVPLIYPAHFDNGFVSWPRPGFRKHNALMLDDYTADQVVPRGTYVLTKRFTSKEEKRRLVAVIYDPVRIDAAHVGFENHLNYFHENGAGLPADFARGLALFLNSTAVDQYFRMFSGHTQVNATDLRNLHYPTREQLAAAGNAYGETLPSQEKIDEAVETLFS